jgi:hypothetical protein
MKASVAVSLALSLAVAALSGCGPQDKPYEKKADYKGKAAAIPAAPNLPVLVKKDGDAWTVNGIVHDLRSVVHHDEVEDKKVSIVGYIVRTNMVPCKDKAEKDGGKEQCVPECAVHKKGKEDPEGCKAPIPTFWIADKAGDTSGETIQVMGWASNFANIHDAIEEIDKTDKDKRKEKEFKEKITDASSSILIPDPLPAVGAKVKVSGQYASTYSSATGLAADPNHGIVHYETMEYLEPAPELANLPSMKERKKDDKK